MQEKSSQKRYRMVLAGLLCAIGVVVPMFMPKVILGPMSFTLASHVAIFIAMFISPTVAVAVCMGTTVGFFLTTSPLIALRAASHLLFALLGASILQKMPDITKRTGKSVLFNVGIAVIHAAAEVAIVTPFFFAGTFFRAEQLTNGFATSVLLLVGVGTALHSIIDYTISIVIWKPLQHVLRPAIKQSKQAQIS